VTRQHSMWMRAPRGLTWAIIFVFIFVFNVALLAVPQWLNVSHATQDWLASIWLAVVVVVGVASVVMLRRRRRN
jgi:hypothetical protein